MNGPTQFTFESRLAQSHRIQDHAFWYDLYEQFFPTMVSLQTYKKYGFWQQQGIDRGIILNTSKQVLVEEKVRYANRYTGRVYEDIALEYWANYEKRKPGWVCKPLMADFILYLILPLRRAYLFPVIQLQAAWEANKTRWKAEKTTITAKNSGSTSKSLCIPALELQSEISRLFSAASF